MTGQHATYTPAATWSTAPEPLSHSLLEICTRDMAGLLCGTKRKKQVSDLHEEGKNAINSPLQPSSIDIHPEDTMLGTFSCHLPSVPSFKMLHAGKNTCMGWGCEMMGSGGRSAYKHALSQVTLTKHRSPDPGVSLSLKPGVFLTEENAERSMIDPTSKEDPKFKELLRVLIDWINNELEEDRIIVKDLEEDLYDGQVLQKLFEKLSGCKLNVAEVTQSEIGQKQKLQTVLEAVNELLRPNGWSIEWSVDSIHCKNLISIVYLLVGLAMHFQAPIRLPERVSVQLVVVKKREGLLQSSHVTKELTTTTEMMMGRFERDAFDTLLDHAPDKLSVVKKSLITFVNKHLNKLNLEVTELETQFADGVYLVLLMGLLEDYFVPLHNFFLTPESVEQKVLNVSFAFELMQDGGLKKPKARPEGEGGVYCLIQPASQFLIDWINGSLHQEHIVVKSLEEDLFDGLILHHLLARLGDVKLDVEEIALTATAQKRKLCVVMDALKQKQKLRLPEEAMQKWSVELIHSRDLLATLHLLVAMAKHFKPELELPASVSVEVLLLEVSKNGIKSEKMIEYITDQGVVAEEDTSNPMDELLKLGAQKVNTVKQAILHFVNKNLFNLGLSVSSMDSQLQNVSLALELLKDQGLLQHPVAPEVDIVSQDVKATLSVLYALFKKYKNKGRAEDS
ncbi:Beta-parvin [Acipenser ruthenus]|uniref:Beta-parvin n=1 Tax=Acipenser ruthenus TaxID=7906 RepID=A0A444UJQ8_ACIRT|nr:Beta-parvin [Acipenser ruthenus]